MGLFTSSSRQNREDDSDKGGDSDDEEDYDVCEEHGHSFRDHGPTEIDTEFRSVETGWPIERGVYKDAVPGKFLGVQYLREKETVPCRDCPEESTGYETLESRIVFRKGGEVKSIARAHYETLVEEEVEEET